MTGVMEKYNGIGGLMGPNDTTKTWFMVTSFPLQYLMLLISYVAYLNTMPYYSEPNKDQYICPIVDLLLFLFDGAIIIINTSAPLLIFLFLCDGAKREV